METNSVLRARAAKIDQVEDAVFQAVLNDERIGILLANDTYRLNWLRAIASKSAEAARAEMLRRTKELP